MSNITFTKIMVMNFKFFPTSVLTQRGKCLNGQLQPEIKKKMFSLSLSLCFSGWQEFPLHSIY